MSHKIVQPLLSFFALLVIYGIAFNLDRYTEYARHEFSRTASPYQFMWSWTLANLLLALCVFFYYTWVMPKLFSWAIGCIVILGLLIDLIPVLYLSPLLNPPPFLFRMPSFVIYRGYFFSVGALTAMAGIFTLFRKRKNLI
jgi:hypothetical protein